VRPAVEHSLEGIVICKLHKRAVKHIGEFHSLFHLVPAKKCYGSQRRPSETFR
jgi:hypothetical protein